LSDDDRNYAANQQQFDSEALHILSTAKVSAFSAPAGERLVVILFKSLTG